MRLPEEFVRRMKSLLGEEYEEFQKSYEYPRNHGLRINTLKLSPEEFLRLSPFPLQPLAWVSTGFRCETIKEEIPGQKPMLPSRHPFYYAGLYYLQEPSAMTPAAILPVIPGEHVLDLCAAPGGKATALAARLQGKGLLVANDLSTSRAKALLKNLENFGAANVFVTNASPEQLAEQFPAYFDKILVDAPCSGEGMFRKDEANARAWSLEKVKECAEIQKGILEQAFTMLRPGGMMVYSTCTFSPEEDEQNVLSFLQKHPEMSLCEIPAYEGFSSGRPDLCREDWDREEIEFQETSDPYHISHCVRIFPHHMQGEGHFMALLQKADSKKESSIEREISEEAHYSAALTVQDRPKKKKELRKNNAKSIERKKTYAPETEKQEILNDFLKIVTMPLPKDRIRIYQDQVYLTSPVSEAIRSIPFLRNGLYLGEIKKGRFEPSQAFAMALKMEEYPAHMNLSSEDPRVFSYLRGETLEIQPGETLFTKGWTLVCVNGYPLGWGKLVNGTLKNKYHPGWRMNY